MEKNKSNFIAKVKKQKFGWLTLLFYGTGNVFWAFANNLRRNVGIANNSVLNSSVSAVAGAFWITVIRETLYLLLFLLYSGPGLFIRRFKDSFTKGGRWMILAVFVNFIGNVMLATGYVYLVTAAFAGTVATSFVVFTFVGAYLIFRTKINLKTILGIIALIAFLGALTFVQINHAGGISGSVIKQIVGAVLIMGAQVGYMIKNIISEYVFKKRLLDVEGVQFMATFWSPFVALIGTLVFLPILQPILVASSSPDNGGNLSLIDGTPFKLFIWMLQEWKIILIVFIASIFLLSGRNCQYQMTRISGAALSNVFYQAKVIIQSVGTIIAYAVLVSISNSSVPVNGPTSLADPWEIITASYLALWYYWVLVIGQVTAVIYTVFAGQAKHEKEQKKYRKRKVVQDLESDYEIDGDIGISRAGKRKA